MLALLAAVACGPSAPTVAPADPAQGATALVEGLGPRRLCQVDRDCDAGGQLGACVLGACCGVLSTDNRTARRVLVGRLEQAGKDLRAVAEGRLIAAYGAPPSGVTVRLGAVEGLGAVLRPAPRATCGEGCKTLRAAMDDDDPRIAAAARVELASIGDNMSLPGLQEDAVEGTELLRAEALRGLRGLAKSAVDAQAKAIALHALGDSSPVVQLAALRTLQAWRTDADVRARLTDFSTHQAPHLTYAVEALTAAGPP